MAFRLYFVALYINPYPKYYICNPGPNIFSVGSSFLCFSNSISQHLRVIATVAVSSGAIHNCIPSFHIAVAEVCTFFFFLQHTHNTHTHKQMNTHVITYMSHPSTFFDDTLNGLKLHLAFGAHGRVCVFVCVCV